MTDNESERSNDSGAQFARSRRRLLAGAGVALAGSVAGCLGGDGGSDGDGGSGDGPGAGTDTTGAGDPTTTAGGDGGTTATDEEGDETTTGAEPEDIVEDPDELGDEPPWYGQHVGFEDSRGEVATNAASDLVAVAGHAALATDDAFHVQVSLENVGDQGASWLDLDISVALFDASGEEMSANTRSQNLNNAPDPGGFGEYYFEFTGMDGGPGSVERYEIRIDCPVEEDWCGADVDEAMPDPLPPCEVVRNEVDGLAITGCGVDSAGLTFLVSVTVENEGGSTVDTHFDVALAVRAFDGDGNEVPIEENPLQASDWDPAREVGPGESAEVEFERTVTDDADPTDVDRFEVTLDPCEGSDCY
ncbi:hypothetical protein BRD00_13375 [Halobacteriales archaeon QS_8_69_26]|nr:MAG: hypothetical protein BRD00_13375 [Halobacteriales archaeon QS_8_69_26]